MVTPDNTSRNTSRNTARKGDPSATAPDPAPNPAPNPAPLPAAPATPPRIVVLGSLNMDIVIRVAEVPARGETVAGESIDHLPGGKGGNQAVSCARQGAAVRMIGCIGNDAHGAALRRALEQDRIDTSGLQVDAQQATGTALVLVEDGGQNRIVYLAGSNGTLTVDEPALATLLADTTGLVLQLETPLPVVTAALRAARRAGCRTVLNPSPVAPLSDAVLGLIDLLVLNEHEAHTLSGLPVASVAEAVAAARQLLTRGPSQVVITLGSAGAVAADASGCRHRPAPRVQAIDTTAAGDTFLGALTTALGRRESLDSAMADGIRAAALCITRRGAQPSIPTRAEVLASPEAPPSVALP